AVIKAQHNCLSSHILIAHRALFFEEVSLNHDRSVQKDSAFPNPGRLYAKTVKLNKWCHRCAMLCGLIVSVNCLVTASMKYFS
ncbi:hypothetical protein N8Q66_25625, partial [Enterobacter hormaechei subsp. steigerwaltii]|nr:hypothetical protein [Enterobacter hormaechei subsp. steigerwaltii]MCU2849413.1 hypothetical protein [Enterobacter hormaechei subsp. steigerwaltii]MCU3562491.1 hypothetical protein [Enterobacter hormaechei subsp. steigerwaltii]